MKVLFTWHAAAEPSYRRLFSKLKDRGVNVRLMAPEMWTEGGRFLTFSRTDSDYYEIVLLKTFFTNRLRGFFYPNLARIIKEISQFRPHIIHIMEEPFSLAAYQFLKIKNFVSPESKAVLFSFENIDVPQNFPFSSFQSFNLRNSHAIVVVPEDGRDIWRKRGYKKAIYNIPLGIDLELFRRVSMDKALGLIKDTNNMDTFKLGYVGRVVREKGVETLVESLGILKDRGCSFRLYVAGGADYDCKKILLKRIRNGGLEDRVLFLDVLAQKELPAFYTLIDTLILPSKTTDVWKEQFGRVLVEAMACEVPCVGSSSGEIPNVIGDGGLIFPEGDAARLADCIHKLMNDKNLRKILAQKAKARAREKYSWDAVADKYLRMYEELIKAEDANP